MKSSNSSMILSFLCWIPQPSLLLLSILQSKPGVVVAFGLVCSSFISISRGSTHRSYFLPEGDLSSLSVAKGNLLAARTQKYIKVWRIFISVSHSLASKSIHGPGHTWQCSCFPFTRLKKHPRARTYLAMLLIMAKKGVWVLEQPSSSIVFRLPWFQELCRKVSVSQLNLVILMHIYIWYIQRLTFIFIYVLHHIHHDLLDLYHIYLCNIMFFLHGCKLTLFLGAR